MDKTTDMFSAISNAVKDAMKSGNALKRECLRSVLAEIKNETVNAGKSISDEVCMKVLKKAVKSHNDSIAQFSYAGRNELLEKEIIQRNEWNNIDIVNHIPLNDLLKNLDLLSEEEKKYASNDWTHIDFVIYNKMDKKMVMAIEVDGYHFHKKGTRQNERDKLKDSILQKYDVPLIRLKTTGSGEEKILEDSIRQFFEDKVTEEVNV